ncbi:MAG: RNA polymerase sigma factor [Gemmatimonadota bacterium]|nr:RNA polymerase sigma factor [Gemmatimonadota bacterium]
MQRTDAELVRDILEGREPAFAELVRRYQDLLYRHAVRMTGAADEAEDVVQAAFVKAYRGLARCEDPERVGSWLFRIGANACKDHLKARRRRRTTPLEDVPEVPSGGDGAAGEAERADLRRALDGALGGLSDERREAFVLKHVEGLSYEEMAELLEASVPALKMRVHRAREELQGLLDGKV